jgi:hypothetical protein
MKILTSLFLGILLGAMAVFAAENWPQSMVPEPKHLRYSIPEPEAFMFYGFYQNPQLVYWSVI